MRDLDHSAWRKSWCSHECRDLACTEARPHADLSARCISERRIELHGAEEFGAGPRQHRSQSFDAVSSILLQLIAISGHESQFGAYARCHPCDCIDRMEHFFRLGIETRQMLRSPQRVP